MIGISTVVGTEDVPWLRSKSVFANESYVAVSFVSEDYVFDFKEDIEVWDLSRSIMHSSPSMS